MDLSPDSLCLLSPLVGWFILVQAMASIAFTFSCLSLISLSIVLMYFLVRHQVVVIIVALVFQVLTGKH